MVQGGGSVLRYAGDAVLAEFPSVVAAVESAAAPGGICISASVFEQVTGKVDKDLLRAAGLPE